MKYTFRIAFLAIFTVLISCAKQPVEQGAYTYETKAFQDWMAQYMPNIPQVADKEGLFMTTPVGSAADAVGVSDTCWVRVNYTLRTFNAAKLDGLGNYVYTRDQAIAEQMGWYADSVQYITEYVNAAPRNYSLTEAQRYALTQMKEGDAVKIYSTSGYTFGSNGYTGFSGTLTTENYGFSGGSVPANKPCVIDMKLVKVVENPKKLELNAVEKFALANTIVTDLKDSLATGLYYKIFEMEGDLTDYNRDTMVIDDTISYWFTSWIVNPEDGTKTFYQTNNDSIALANNRLPYLNGELRTIMLIKDGGAQNRVLYKMKKGDKAIFISTSTYIGNSAGDFSSVPYLQPYTPVYYEVETAAVLKKKDEEDKDKK